MNYKGFHQLQWEDRLVIEKMLKVGDSKAKIAEALGVCKKTIYNEIKRGWTQQMTSDYEFIWCYCPEMAERKYQENLRAKGPDLKIGNDIDFANLCGAENCGGALFSRRFVSRAQGKAAPV